MLLELRGDRLSNPGGPNLFLPPPGLWGQGSRPSCAAYRFFFPWKFAASSSCVHLQPLLLSRETRWVLFATWEGLDCAA